MATTYSFLDVHVGIVGPGGAFPMGGDGAANSEEGITISPSQDLNKMDIGADGTPMHSLHADKSGRMTVRLLKTSPVNALLSALVNFQRASGSTHGRNTILVTNTATGDVITCQRCAFRRVPDLAFAKDGGMNDWEFDCGIIDSVLGNLT